MAATEAPEQTQLCEITSNQAAKAAIVEFKVADCEIVEYTYGGQGRQVPAKKLQVTLVSQKANAYCLGTARMQRNDEQELKLLSVKFGKNTVWKMSQIILFQTKGAFINTPCRLDVDLRRTKTDPLLQSPHFPKTVEPKVTVADVLKLTSNQRFDVMALVSKILAHRQPSNGTHVIEVLLVDGSKETAEAAEYASLPLTMWFHSDTQATEFQTHVGKTPLNFICLSGWMKDGKVTVSTVKGSTKTHVAEGDKATAMEAQAATLCGENVALKNVASLPSNLSEQKDYINCPATLVTCHILNPANKVLDTLLAADAKEGVFQVNLGHIMVPSKDAKLTTTDNRLFTRLMVVDGSDAITVAARSKVMLNLAGLQDGQDDQYMRLIQSDELRHPTLVSFRVIVQRQQPKGDGDASATEQSQTISQSLFNVIIVEVDINGDKGFEIPNDNIQPLHGLYAGALNNTERFAVVPLSQLSCSPFYHICVAGKAVERALTLLRFTDRTSGQVNSAGQGVRVVGRVADGTVKDATESTLANSFGTVAVCTVAQVTEYTAKVGSLFLAVISKVCEADKPLINTADFQIETMEEIETDRRDLVIDMITKLQQIVCVQDGDTSSSTPVPFEPRKCRRLNRWPTVEGTESCGSTRLNPYAAGVPEHALNHAGA